MSIGQQHPGSIANKYTTANNSYLQVRHAGNTPDVCRWRRHDRNVVTVGTQLSCVSRRTGAVTADNKRSFVPFDECACLLFAYFHPRKTNASGTNVLLVTIYSIKNARCAKHALAQKKIKKGMEHEKAKELFD